MTISKTFIKTKNSYKVTFEVPKEKNVDNLEIRLLGDFNHWNWEKAPSLKAAKNSYKVEVELSAGNKYEFRYCVNKNFWFNDDHADAYVPAPYDNIMNCVLHLPEVVAEEAVKVTPKAKATTTKATKTKTDKVDLTKVEGIGPKIAQLLIDAGIATYEALAAAKADQIKDILNAAGKRYQMHDPTTWPQQSKLLATGKLDELKKLQDELKGGKKA